MCYDESKRDNATLRQRIAEIEKDKERLDWLESTVQGTGASAFLKSIFITTEFGSKRICVDVKTEGVWTRDTLRAAIDAALPTIPKEVAP